MAYKRKRNSGIKAFIAINMGGTGKVEKIKIHKIDNKYQFFIKDMSKKEDNHG